MDARTAQRPIIDRQLTSYAKVRRLVTLLRLNRRWQVASALRTGKRYLNVGCGPKPAPGFINMDLDWRPGVDLCWDLVKGIPLPDASMQAVYSEHCLEHFDPAGAHRVLVEFARVLAPGGTARIIVPDAELYLDLYQRAKTSAVAFPFWEATRFESGELTPLMAVNHMIFHYGHLYMYDFPTMRKFLLDAGFSSVERKKFGEGSPVLLLDSPERECESLYVEARK